MARAVAAETRAGLAALAGVDGQGAILWEDGRESLFTYDASDLSAEVADDSRQGIYIAPSSAPLGDAGAWVRQHGSEVYPEWWGAAGNCTGVGVGTDDYAAFAAAIAYLAKLGGPGTLRLRKKIYRLSQRLAFTDPIHIQGEGWHFNSGSVDGETYSLFESQNRGSSLVFDSNTAGLIFYSITDSNDALAVAASIGSLGTASPEFKFQGSHRSTVRDVMLYGGGGTNTTAHGIEVRTVVFMDRVMIYRFAGDGLRVDADTGSASTPYGNADASVFNSVRISEVGMNGIRTRGNDANIIHFNACDTTLCGGYGVVEGGFLGNYYRGHHFSVNNQSYGAATAQRAALIADFPELANQYEGAARSVGAVNVSSFTDCYSESSLGNLARIMKPTSVTGGTLANDSNLTTDSSGVVLSTSGVILRGHHRAVNSLDAVKVGFNVGADIGDIKVAFSWGSLEENADALYRSWRMVYNELGDKWWTINGYGSIAAHPIAFPTSGSALNQRAGASVYGPAFPHGYFLGGPSYGPLLLRQHGTAAPTTGAYSQGDIVFNSAPAAGGFIGWVCVTAGSPGTWKTFGAISA